MLLCKPSVMTLSVTLLVPKPPHSLGWNYTWFFLFHSLWPKLNITYFSPSSFWLFSPSRVTFVLLNFPLPPLFVYFTLYIYLSSSPPPRAQGTSLPHSPRSLRPDSLKAQAAQPSSSEARWSRKAAPRSSWQPDGRSWAFILLMGKGGGGG